MHNYNLHRHTTSDGGVSLRDNSLKMGKWRSHFRKYYRRFKGMMPFFQFASLVIQIFTTH